MSRVTPWTTGRGGLDVPQAGGILDRRGLLVLGCSSQLLLLRLDVSDVGPVERVAVRARTTPPTGSLRADVPGSRTHPALPLVASCRCSVCSLRNYRVRAAGPRARHCPGPSPTPTGADDGQRSRRDERDAEARKASDAQDQQAGPPIARAGRWYIL
jgi:hypothetical protein